MAPREILEQMTKEDLLRYIDRVKRLYESALWVSDYQGKIIRSLQDAVEDMSYLVETKKQYTKALAEMSDLDHELAKKYSPAEIVRNEE